MSNTIDSITEAARLRRSVLEVQRELEAKQCEHQQRMVRVREGEEQLAKDRAELQDTLVQYYKFIQENEVKRSRATKKATIEERQRLDREAQLQTLSQQLHELEERREGLKKHYDCYAKYQVFLEDVLSRSEGDEYQEPQDIITRWMTLKDNTKVLQDRKTQLEEDLLRNKNALGLARQHRNSENVALQNQLNELQMTFESLQKTVKLRQDDVERMMKQKGTTSRTVSHIGMATKNLYERCVQWSNRYSGRGESADSKSVDVLHQLHIIGNTLEDFEEVMRQHLDAKLKTASQPSYMRGKRAGTEAD